MRVRGVKGVRRDIVQALKQLHLTRKNHCVVLESSAPWVADALRKIKDYIAWGELAEKTSKELSSKRKMEFSVERDGFKLQLYRLNNPMGGWKNIKLYYPKGDLGNRGDKINLLIEKMLH